MNDGEEDAANFVLSSEEQHILARARRHFQIMQTAPRVDEAFQARVNWETGFANAEAEPPKS